MGLRSRISQKIESGRADPTYSVVRCLAEQLGRLTMEKPVTLDRIVIRNVKTVEENDPIEKAWRLMEKGNFSQLPVVSERGPVRLITDQSIAAHKGAKLVKEALAEEGGIQLFRDLNVTIDEARETLRTHQVILIQDTQNGIVGIVTAADPNALSFKKKKQQPKS